MTAIDINPEEVDWIKAYADSVSKPFGTEFDRAGNRFKDSKRELERFTESINATLSNGRGYIAAADAAHNELCIASALLSNSDPHFKLLEYEPTLPGCAKSIDFRATTGDDHAIFIDVKTIQPQVKDRWEQFERARREGWLPENVRVVLEKGWLAGELWHDMFAARSRMLEYTLQLEAKIRDGKLATDKTSFILALCGEGFHWHRDELEDFVAFYGSGRHRPDDPFSKAEAKEMAEKKISLDRTIGRFACMSRPQFEIRQRRLNWNVQPPTRADLAQSS